MQAQATSSACSDKQAHLAHRLHEAVPQGAKLALCFDPEGDLNGLDYIIDTAERTWQIVIYREDDLALRLAIRTLEADGWTADSPVLLRVAMPDLVPLTHRIDPSFLGDILQWVEGAPIDLRTDAVVTFHTEPVVWPEHLQAHAARISRDLKGFIDGYWWMRKAIGAERPLGRHHIEYLYDIEHPAGIIVPYSGKKGASSVTVLVGRAWFTREKGRYTRYAHGGVSLPEMVVPGAVLRKLEAPEAIRLVITAPEKLRVQEDDDVEVPISIRNGGTGRVAIRVTIGQAAAQTAELSRGAERSFTERLSAELGLKFIAILIEAKGPDGRYAVVKGGSRQIPVTVRERTDKVEFSRALDAFSDIE
jgi:hypothetical protein